MNNSEKLILIVDDNLKNLQLTAKILKDEEFLISLAQNGKAAIQQLEKYTPDLILLDIMMPEMDGYEVCRRLKSDFTTKHIPVIFITAMTGVEDEKKGYDVGCVDFITKPISPPIVQARVKTHLALYNQNRELDRKVSEKTKQLNETRLQIIQRLGRAAEYKDDETGMHVIRMSYYSRLLAIAAGMSEAEAETFVNAAPMHDIGKIGIPDNILKKPGPLTDEEFDIMRSHTVIGGEIIGDDASELLRLARIVAVSHHEKWNGKGYPLGLSGEEIPKVGRIIAIADVFDALTSSRPYKKAWPVEKAIALLIDEKGQHFDPHLVDLFVEIMPQIMEIYEEYGDKRK